MIKINKKTRRDIKTVAEVMEALGFDVFWEESNGKDVFLVSKESTRSGVVRTIYLSSNEYLRQVYETIGRGVGQKFTG